ncbi:MAG: Mut7-C RNAse domain-containing protein [Sedimenticolaceae bacterium]
MAHATLRFYAELNDYLPAALRQRDITLDFRPPCPVRHLVETLQVPHTEIEILLINGVSVDLEATVYDGDRISVYPVWEAIDVAPLLRLRNFPLRETRFFADAQLGRLARYLRLLGFDTLYSRDIDDADLVRQAVAQRRIVLTRDRDLLMRRAVTHGCHIRQDDPVAQLRYVIARCDLTGSVHPFTRCMECNDLIDPVRKAAILDQLEPITRDAFHDFWRCRGCGRIYWKGSHFEKLQGLIDAVL